VSDSEVINENGKEYLITPEGQRIALGLVPDLDPPRLTTLCRALGKIPSMVELIDFVESGEYQNNVGGMAHFDSSWTKYQNGWGKCASSAATYNIE
jgi:hypothetical protein